MPLLIGAAAIGGVVGVVSGEVDVPSVTGRLKPLAADMGLMRARAPQFGDRWPGCNAARAAGTAPIYRGEPGYREGMDGDGDGVACEPYPGSSGSDEHWHRFRRRH